MSEFPWAPIFTIERSNQAEVSISGIISVVAGNKHGDFGKQLLAVGDVNHEMWTRSLLKPWQLLSHLPVLKAAYQELRPHHFALMTASHSAEPDHLCVLREMLRIGSLTEDMLKCPPAVPLSTEMRLKCQQDGESAPRTIFNECSGKHVSFLLSLKAQGAALEDYLQKDGEHFVRLKNILSVLIGRPASSLKVTTDGCRLPNYALSANEIANLYYGLMSKNVIGNGDDRQRSELLGFHDELSEFMLGFPHLISGTGRVDANIMQGRLANNLFLAPTVAKQGADGLLALGVGPCQAQPNGVGVLIKIASGFVPRYMELIVCQLFKQLGLIKYIGDKEEASGLSHLKTHFHFSTEPLG